jgi:hypothetical protein
MSVWAMLILLIYVNYIGGGNLDLVIQIIEVACNVLSLLLKSLDYCARGSVMFW